MICPVQPQSRAVPIGLGGQAGRAAGGGGVAAAQPRGGDHRRGDRRADDGGQRVQAPDQQRFPLDLRVPEPRALLVVAVDAFLHGVDIDERQRARAGQQRRLPGQLRQELPACLLQLGDVAPGIAAQVRAQRGRRPDAAEQRAHRAVPQQVHVIDAVRARRHPGDQARDLQVRVDAAFPARADVLRDQVASPARCARAITGTSPACDTRFGSSNDALRPREAMQQSHLQGVLSNRVLEASDTPILPGQRAPFTLTRPKTPLIDRWIEA